ncbi:MAG: hypothetical protein WD334_06550 [Chitinophagales bacterium]
MKYLTFEKAMQTFPVFSIKDIEKQFPGFDRRRLVEWQEKGYLTKIRRGFYYLSVKRKDQDLLYFAANKIYSPSYISLESGLAFYGLIPEAVFSTISASTRNTASFDTPVGHFKYRHIKPTLFFGYKLIKTEGVALKIAEAEKVILDYLYLNKVNSFDEMEALRWNKAQIIEVIDFQKLNQYLKVFDSLVLNKRINLFKKMMHA